MLEKSWPNPHVTGNPFSVERKLPADNKSATFSNAGCHRWTCDKASMPNFSW